MLTPASATATALSVLPEFTKYREEKKQEKEPDEIIVPVEESDDEVGFQDKKDPVVDGVLADKVASHNLNEPVCFLYDNRLRRLRQYSFVALFLIVYAFLGKSFYNSLKTYFLLSYSVCVCAG